MSLAVKHDVDQLIEVFNDLFQESYQTVLVRGEGEPEYLVADETHASHRIIFANGYFSSALHEIAHWCIAGKKRRELNDFGYWYRPDGRTAAQQAEFEQVEVKPQALEWIFSVAANHKFVFSADNLSGESTDNTVFKQRVHTQVMAYLERGLPKRARLFTEALSQNFGEKQPLEPARFALRTGFSGKNTR